MKSTSYSKPQKLPIAPASKWSNKLRVNSYDANGRPASCTDGERTLPAPEKTRHIVAFRDLK
jgi:hypothetical protein